MSGSIEFTTDYQRKIVYLHHGSSLNAVETFANFLLNHSTAGIKNIAQSDSLRPEIAERPGGAYGTTDFYAKIIMKCLDNGEIYVVNIPAPVESMFEEVIGRGFRVKQAIGEQITAEYANLSGKTFEFRYGWLKSDR